ncbi:hypothetical protein Hanom_Chr14g01282061 [Helianthus anomalus]
MTKLPLNFLNLRIFNQNKMGTHLALLLPNEPTNPFFNSQITITPQPQPAFYHHPPLQPTPSPIIHLSRRTTSPHLSPPYTFPFNPPTERKTLTPDTFNPIPPSITCL